MRLLPLLLTTAPALAQMTVTPHPDSRRIDITWANTPVTSLLWPTSLAKPVLDPLIAPGGVIVTRGYPLFPRPGERVDHPHHAGMWFNYGNVNGFDFWNNSTAIPAADKSRYGTVEFQRLVSSHSGPTQAELVYDALWRSGTGQPLLEEHTRLVFTHASATETDIDRTTTLTALTLVTFKDDKEGLLGIRVAHFLESATEKGGTYLDASGKPTTVTAADTSGATGVYLTSAGKQGDAAWGTRGNWCLLTGTPPPDPALLSLAHDSPAKSITIAIFDHPGNPGYPTYWHARGYGLFAANPLGVSIFDKSQKPFEFSLAKDASATFRYRVALFDRTPNPSQMNAEAAAYALTK